VKMSELANRLDVGGDVTESPDGFVTRGEKGREVLYKMPLRLYRLLERRKSDDNIKHSRSAKRLKTGTQNRMAQDADADGVTATERDGLHRGIDRIDRMNVELTESSERVELDS
jgi:hypothetical protein